MKMIFFYIFVLFSTDLLANKNNNLVIYSERKKQLLDPYLKAFSQKTKIKVVLHTAKALSLIHQMDLEKKTKKTKADLFISVDFTHLMLAQKKNLLQRLPRKKSFKKIKPFLKSSYWLPLSLRLRTIFYHPNKIKDLKNITYFSLADKRFKNKLCLRTSKKVYNQSLVSSMLYHLGMKKTKKMIKGWVSNLKYPVFSSDTELLKAIAKGTCSIGIANSYYYERLVFKDPKIKKNLKVLWPNQKTSGVHVNLSGVGILKNAPSPKNAELFIDWMLKDGQKLLYQNSGELPVHIKHSFKIDKSSLKRIARFRQKAIFLSDKMGYK